MSIVIQCINTLLVSKCWVLYLKNNIIISMSLFNKFRHTAHCSLKVVLEFYDFFGVGHKCCKIGPQLFPTTLHLVIYISNLWFVLIQMYTSFKACCSIVQGILKGEVSLYCWPPVWLVWNQVYDNWQFLFLFAKHAYPNQSNRRSTVQWYFPL